MRDRETIVVVVADRASLFELAVPIGVFGVDRSDSGAPAFRLIAVSAHGGSAAATTASLTVAGLTGLDGLRSAGVIIVPTWPDPGVPPSPALVQALRDAVDDGGTVLGLCLGAYVLGYAGLLDGRRALTHWRWLDDFARRFPAVRVDDSSLYVDEGRVITSAGTAAGLDACLHYARREWGAAVASAIARRMVVAPHRSGNQYQYVEPTPAQPADSSIAAVQQRALAEPAGAVTVDHLAAWYGASRRTFDRDFRAATGSSPLQWLLHQRILAAQRLLEGTDLGIEEISHRVGFSSAISLRPHFRRILGVSPQQYRTAFSTVQESIRPTMPVS